jgi:hypothetical protein
MQIEGDSLLACLVAVFRMIEVIIRSEPAQLTRRRLFAMMCTSRLAGRLSHACLEA